MSQRSEGSPAAVAKNSTDSSPVVTLFSTWRFTLFASLCGGLLTAWMLRDGIALTPDGWEYWEGSVSLLEGRGYRYFGGEPIRLYPALFPLFLAMIQGVVSPTGLGLVIAVALLASMTTGVWIHLFCRLAGPAMGFSWVRVGLLLFFAQFIAYSYVALLSETIFLLFLGMGLIAVTSLPSTNLLHKPIPLALLGVVLCTSALVASRNVGLVFVPGFACAVVLRLRGRPVSRSIAAGILALAVPIGVWFALRFVFEQGGTHSPSPPELGLLKKLLLESVQGVPALLAGRSTSLGILIALCVVSALASLSVASFESGTFSRRQATGHVASVSVLGFVGLVIAMSSIDVVDPLAGRFIWFVPMSAMVILAAAENWLPERRHRRLIQLVITLVVVGQFSRATSLPDRLSTRVLLNQSMAIEFVERSSAMNPHLEHVVPPRYPWIIKRRGYLLTPEGRLLKTEPR